MPKVPKPIKKYQLYVFRHEKTDITTTNNIIHKNTPVAPVTPLPPNPNKPIDFGTMKSDEEIVYNTYYKYNLDIDTLINNSNTTRLAKSNEKKGTNKVPRRQNAWILYRRDKNASPDFVGMKSGAISLKIQDMWEHETKEVRELFSALSNLAERRHIERYGIDYKYQPIQSKQVKNQKKTKQKKERKEEKRKELVQSDFEETYHPLDHMKFKNATFNTFNFSSIEPIDPIIPSVNQLQQFDFIKQIQEPFTPEPTLHSFPNYSHHFNLFYDKNFTADMNENVSENNNDEFSLFNEYICYEDLTSD